MGRKSLPFLRRRLQRLKTGPSHERVELVIANRAGFGQTLKWLASTLRPLGEFQVAVPVAFFVFIKQGRYGSERVAGTG